MALNLESIKRAADKREREIMKLHSQGWTMRELGVRFEITFQRVQQIISRAKRTQKFGKAAK